MNTKLVRNVVPSRSFQYANLLTYYLITYYL